MDERYKNIGPFKVDRRQVRRIKSYIFLSLFFILWTSAVMAYSGEGNKENTLIYWLGGLIIAAFKKIFIDNIQALRDDIRRLTRDKQDKIECDKRHTDEKIYYPHRRGVVIDRLSEKKLS